MPTCPCISKSEELISGQNGETISSEVRYGKKMGGDSTCVKISNCALKDPTGSQINDPTPSEYKSEPMAGLPSPPYLPNLHLIARPEIVGSLR